MTKEELKTKIGLRTVELRERKGWSQSDLARACDKDRQAIEKIERGIVNPTVFTLWELSDAMEMTLDEFLDMEN